MSDDDMKLPSESKVIHLNDKFWSEQPRILIEQNRLVEFIPTPDMTRKEKLNALARFFIVVGFVLILYTGDTWPIYITILGMAFTLFLFKTAKEFRGKTAEKVFDLNVEKEAHKQVFTTDIDRDRGIENIQGCTAPTKNNPFMNVTMNEWLDNPVRPPACDYKDVKDQVEDNFHYNLYQDLGDNIWDKNNSQRQFYTTPFTTIPNDQTSFANWLYNVGDTCKQQQTNCNRYTDLRAARPIIGDSEHLV